MWRTYTSDIPTHLLSPTLSIRKGDKVILDTEYTPAKCKYFIVYNRGDKQEPIKFEVSDKTWTKIAERSQQP